MHFQWLRCSYGSNGQGPPRSAFQKHMDGQGLPSGKLTVCYGKHYMCVWVNRLYIINA